MSPLPRADWHARVRTAMGGCVLCGKTSFPMIDMRHHGHPGLPYLGGEVCLKDAKWLIRDAKSGDMELTDPEGNPVDITGHRLDGGPDDPQFLRKVENANDAWAKISGTKGYLPRTT